MKKIIKQSPIKHFQVDCDRCSCSFIYDHKDLYPNLGELVVSCPVCDNMIKHSDSKPCKENENTDKKPESKVSG